MRTSIIYSYLNSNNYFEHTYSNIKILCTLRLLNIKTYVLNRSERVILPERIFKIKTMNMYNSIKARVET